MRGSMRRRGDAWQLRVYAGRGAVTGRKRWITRTVRGGKRQAERELSAMVLAVERDEVGTEATVGALLARWFEHASPDWSPRTVVQHRHVIDRYLEPRFGGISRSGRRRRASAARPAPGPVQPIAIGVGSIPIRHTVGACRAPQSSRRSRRFESGGTSPTSA